MSTNTPIASQTLTSAVSSVTFTGIPQNYTDLVLIATARLTSSNTDRLGLRFNDDTSTNYSITYLLGDGSTAQSGRQSSIDEMRFYNQSTANFYPSIINIMNYANTTTYKTAIGRTSAADISTVETVGLWRSTAAITKIDVISPNTFTSGTTFNLYGIVTGSPKASGGNTITTDGTYWYHTFTSSGAFTPAQALTADYLVVAGGGGGGSQVGGGGGAGGYRYLTAQALNLNTLYTVTVGAGGAGGTAAGNGVANSKGSSGSNSVFSTITASGGGGGASYGASYKNGISGGSGGGGSYQDSPSSTGTAGSGNAGSYSPVEGFAGGTSSALGSAGGGGGSSAVGSNSVGAAGGAGGAGTANSISGSSVTYAGGGGGASNSGSAAAGGAGGGGSGGVGTTTVSTAGTVNTGGGGGGQRDAGGANGSSGGSGIVIVRYAV